MSTDILTPLTLAEIEAGAVPMLYYGIIYDTGFDPAEPWYPCGCPYRLEDSHEGDCWLGWIAYPTWMKEPTGDLVIIRRHTGEIAKIVDARPPSMLRREDFNVSDVDDEDDSSYVERYYSEPRSSDA